MKKSALLAALLAALLVIGPVLADCPRATAKHCGPVKGSAFAREKRIHCPPASRDRIIHVEDCRGPCRATWIQRNEAWLIPVALGATAVVTWKLCDSHKHQDAPPVRDRGDDCGKK